MAAKSSPPRNRFVTGNSNFSESGQSDCLRFQLILLPVKVWVYNGNFDRVGQRCRISASHQLNELKSNARSTMSLTTIIVTLVPILCALQHVSAAWVSTSSLFLAFPGDHSPHNNQRPLTASRVSSGMSRTGAALNGGVFNDASLMKRGNVVHPVSRLNFRQRFPHLRQTR